MRSRSRPVACLQAREPVLVADGVVGRPLHPRVAGAELGGQARQRGGGERLGDDAKAGTAVRGMRLGQRPPRRDEIAPGLRCALQRDRLRAVGIVEAEHGGLDARARGPEGRGVRGVALDLRRSPFVALDDQAVGAPAERHASSRSIGGSRERPPRERSRTGRCLRPAAGTRRAPRATAKRPASIIMSRRVTPSGSSDAPSGNSRSRKARDSGRSSSSRETSPVCRCHRWHPEQSVGGLTGRTRVELRRERPDVPRRSPLHVGDLRDGSPVGAGVAVAVEAPAHAERLHLRDRFHLVDAAVAGDTADACRHVRVVREIGEVGKLVDANPAHRPTAGGAFANRCEQLAVLHHELMAVHAGPRRRHVRDGRNLDRGVTVAAIETKVADVELVAVRNGLNGTIADVCVPRGIEVPDARDHEDRTEAAREGGDDRELVPPRGKDLAQWLGLRIAGG